MKAEAVDARSDLYSVGVTLYEMVTGQPPVQGTSFYSILKAHMEAKPRPATELAPHLPPELSRIISKSLEKRPEARFQSAGEFHAALSRVTFESASSSDAARILREVPASDAPTATLRIEVPVSDEATPTPPVPQTSTASKSWDPVVLENARKSLAVFVGPMAKFLVNRAAKNALNVAELYQALASEIASPSDREQFLRSQPL